MSDITFGWTDLKSNKQTNKHTHTHTLIWSNFQAVMHSHILTIRNKHTHLHSHSHSHSCSHIYLLTHSHSHSHIHTHTHTHTLTNLYITYLKPHTHICLISLLGEQTLNQINKHTPPNKSGAQFNHSFYCAGPKRMFRHQISNKQRHYTSCICLLQCGDHVALIKI